MTASSNRSIARWTGVVALSAASLAVALTSLAPGSFSYRSWPKPPGPGSVRSLVARTPTLPPQANVVPDRVRVPVPIRVPARPPNPLPKAPARGSAAPTARPAPVPAQPARDRSPQPNPGPKAPSGGSDSGKPTPSQTGPQAGVTQTAPAAPIATRVQETVPPAPLAPRGYHVYQAHGGGEAAGCPHDDTPIPGDNQHGDAPQPASPQAD